MESAEAMMENLFENVCHDCVDQSGGAQATNKTRKRLSSTFLAKCSRLCELMLLFSSSLMTVFTGYLKSDDYGDKCTETNSQERKHASFQDYNLDQLGRSNRLKRIYSKYLFSINCLYIWWTLVALVSIMLDFDPFSAYKYVDCFIVGRISLIARISRATKYISSMVIIFFFTYRQVIALFRPRFYLELLDFIHRDLGSVIEANQRSDMTRLKLKATSDTCVRKGGQDKREIGADSEGRELCYKVKRLDESGELDRLDVECMFAQATCSSNYFIIKKLNRSPLDWFMLNAAMVIWTIGMLLFIISTVFWLTILMTPTIVTKRGFELCYPNCIDYIRDYANGSESRAQEFGSIYDPSRVLLDKNSSKGEDVPVLLPLKDFVSGYYHSFRIACDFFSTLALFIDGIVIFYSNFIFHTLLCIDLLLNSRKLHARLLIMCNNRRRQLAPLRLLGARESKPQIESSHLELVSRAKPKAPIDSFRIGSRHGGVKYHRTNRGSLATVHDVFGNYNTKRSMNQYYQRIEFSVSRLELQSSDHSETLNETIVMQALLLDHFRCASEYNKYISNFGLYYVGFWLAFTCLSLAWLGVTDGEAVEREFIITEAIILFSIFCYLLMLSFVHNSSRAFYPLISSLMALDSWHSATKLRWMIILNHYQRKPMYCFTLLSAEVSNWLILRIIAWNISALVVVISFFYERLARMRSIS